GNGTAGNNPPNGTIVSPASDIVISRYQSVNFTSNFFDADGDNVVYHWDFDGVTYNRTNAHPGWISFDETGTFEIILTVTDSRGLSDTTPAKRKITVVN
ncbi:MAG: PKD domain-containing protein, partial [Gammaproteobacteria bacterium]|nr:PKD domain-containing protein [Gammaproteobacteria bacterium]